MTGEVFLVITASFSIAIAVVSNGLLGDILTCKYLTAVSSAIISAIGYSLTIAEDDKAFMGWIIEWFGLGILFCTLSAFISEPGNSIFKSCMAVFSSWLLGSTSCYYILDMLGPLSRGLHLSLLIVLITAMRISTAVISGLYWGNTTLSSEVEKTSATIEPMNEENVHLSDNRTEHSYDYYYQAGAKLRPPPHRTLASPDWLPMRKRLFSRYINVQASPRRSPLVQMLQDHFWQGDELMDRVISWGQLNGMGRARRLLMEALEQGIEAVPEAPMEIKELFQKLDRKPSWFNEEDYENGRVVLANASRIGRLTALAMNFITTSQAASVASAVGSTAQYTNPRTVMRRHLETVHFFHRITLPGGSDRFSDTFKEIVKVRFMHSQVRQAIKVRWGDVGFSTHGNPISNTDMAIGITAFGVQNLIVDAAFGRYTPIGDLDAATRHWGYIAYVFGVAEEIIPRNFQEAVEEFDYILSSHGNPPEWSAKIADSQLIIPERAIQLVKNRFLRWSLNLTALPFFHGLLYFFGGDTLGYRILSTRYRSRIRMKIQAVFAVTVAKAIITLSTILSKWPGRESRMRAYAAKGSPSNEFALHVLEEAAREAGVRHVTFETHDNSKPGDFKTLKVWTM